MKHVVVLVGSAIAIATWPLLAQVATLRGMVRSASGQGLPDAAIILRDLTDAAETVAVVTDPSGKFEIQLESGSYSLYASKTGFVRDDPALDYFSAQQIWVANGTVTPTPVLVHLFPQGVITGTILDETADPLEKVRVSVYRRDLYGEKPRLIQMVPAARSDDRGRYRIAGLPPGRYYVVADRLGTDGAVPVFYPGEVSFDKAVEVNLESGVTRQDINIQWLFQKGRHIRGSVVDQAGQPVPRAQIWAIPEGGAFDGIEVSRLLYHAETQADAAGRFDIGIFELSPLPPGAYSLRALGIVDPSTAPSQDGFMALGPRGVQAGKAVLYGTGEIIVGGADVELVRLQLQSGLNLNGVVRREEGPVVENALLRFQAERSIEAKLLSDFETRSGPDGTFTFPNAWLVPYDISISNLPPGTYVKRFTYGKQDLLTGRLELTKGDGGLIEVVLGASTPMRGTVRTGVGSIAADVQVFVWPVAAHSVDDFLPVAVRADGTFTLDHFAPGDYYIVAAESVDPRLQRNPIFRQAISQLATQVSLTASSPQEGIILEVVGMTQIQQLSGPH